MNWKQAAADIALRTIKTVCQTSVGLLAGSTMISQVDFGFMANCLAFTALTTIIMNTASYLEKIERVKEDEAG